MSEPTAADLWDKVDYWIPQVRVVRLPRGVINGDGIGSLEASMTLTTTVWQPSTVARSLRMLAHFRALDRDDDEDEWTPYHEFRARTDPPPWGEGRVE